MNKNENASTRAGSVARGWVSLLLLTVVLVSLNTWAAHLYVASEKFIFYWDWNGFIGITREFCEAFANSPQSAATFLIESLKGEYNLVFAVPISLIFGWDTDSRQLYIGSLAALYVTAFCIAMGRVIKKAFPECGEGGVWCAAFLAVAVPTAWHATMLGYPDPLAAACILFGFAILLADTQLRSTRTFVAVAFLLGLGTVVRRHMAYAVLALLVSVSLTIAIAVLRDVLLKAERSPLTIIVRLVKPGMLAVLVVLWLVVLDPFFLKNILENDYGSLYSSYQQSTASLLRYFYTDVIGRVYFSVGVVGCVLGLVTGWRRLNARFVASLFALMWLIVWVSTARQRGLHQLIVGLPLLATVGIFNIYTTLRGSRARVLAVVFAVCIGLYAVGNATLIYGTHYQNYDRANRALGIFTEYAAPLRRDDFDNIRALVSGLRDGKQPVLVAASSGNLNFDVVTQAEKLFYPPGHRLLTVDSSPQIDSRDPLPIEDLLQAFQVVVVKPFQHHISADQQQVVETVGDIVSTGAAASEFQTTGQRYALEKDATAMVYRRTAPTPLPLAVSILAEMQHRVTATNHIFRDYWFLSDYATPSGNVWNPDGSRNFFVRLHAEPFTATLMRKVTGPVRFNGTLYVAGTFCKGLTVTGGTSPVHFSPTVEPVPLTVSALPDATGFVSLKLITDQGAECDVIFRQLKSNLPD
ncbi:hypothetical protein [Burkholderia sp. S171]|uniref:hypothetical protein n=1 Tax=Burkholderia sp. S171 TaxID=1641860 RepID=UPI00131D7F00|nr:hypothetical protein [Burkholderia sp. S171]